MADVSVVVAFRNAARWLPACFESVLSQELPLNFRLQLSTYDDASEDDSGKICSNYEPRFRERGFDFTTARGDVRLGVGGAKNRAIRRSNGKYLCFLDADDEMMPHRIRIQYEAAREINKNHFIIGTSFIREPADSTIRYTRWANSLTNLQLYSQIYTSFGPTLIAPTWFFPRKLFEEIGGFREQPVTGFPEDLDFFYKALRLGAILRRVDDMGPAVLYRYHTNCASFGVAEETIRKMRVEELEERVIRYWNGFYIWNAGRTGRYFYKTLSEENRRKLIAFVDVDEKKIRHGFYEFAESPSKIKPRVPILGIENVRPPFIVCVKLDMTKGVLESYIRETGYEEGKDFYFAG